MATSNAPKKSPAVSSPKKASGALPSAEFSQDEISRISELSATISSATATASRKIMGAWSSISDESITVIRKTGKTVGDTIKKYADKNDDGKIGLDDFKIIGKEIWSDQRTVEAREFLKVSGGKLLTFGKGVGIEVIESDMGQAAIKGGAAGAIVAVPLPLVGPMIGLLLGAGAGVYFNFKYGKKIEPKDVPDLLKLLDELKDKGVISQDEYEKRYKKLIKMI